MEGKRRIIQRDRESLSLVTVRAIRNLWWRPMLALKYLETRCSDQLKLAKLYNSLPYLYKKNPWHQPALKLEQFVALAVLRDHGAMHQHLESTSWRMSVPIWMQDRERKVVLRKCTSWWESQAGDHPIQLYHNFISDFETKINLLKLAHFAVTVSCQYTENGATIAYLEEVIEKLRATREMKIEEPILYVQMQIAVFKLEGNRKECKKLLDEGKITLDSMSHE